MHSRQIYILFWFFYVVSYMPSLSFNYFLSVEFWPKGLLKMCEHRLYICALADILLQKCVLYNRIRLQFKWQHSTWSGTLQKRHFVRVHAMLHKYWLLQKIYLWGQSSLSKVHNRILKKQQKWLDFCIENKKQLLQFNQMFFWHLSFEILFFLWTFGSHLHKDKHLMQDNVSFNIRWPFDTKSIDFYLDLEIIANWNIQ